MWKIWFSAFRPRTLTASLCPVMAVTALCRPLDLFGAWWVSLLALFSAFSIQIATNLFNDIMDFKKGADNKNRLGPRRPLQENLVQEKQVWFMAFLFLFLSVLFGLPLVIRGGFFILIPGLISCFLTYAYTGGRVALAYRGLGDFFVILFFGLFASVGTGYLQSLKFHPSFFVIGLQTGFLSTTLIAINNLRDSRTDRLAGKKTLATRFGDNFIFWEILILILWVYLLNFYYFLFLSNFFISLTLFALPLGLSVIRQASVFKNKSELNRTLGTASLHQLVFSLLFSLGVVL